METKKVPIGKRAAKVEEEKLVPHEINVPGISGTLPFASKPVNKTELPAYVKAEISGIQKEYEAVTLDKAKSLAVTPPVPVNIDDLAPEKLKEVTQAIKDMAGNTKSKMPAIVSPSTPAVLDALKIAEQAENYVPPEPQPDIPEPVDIKTICVHCGFPVDSTDITDPDKLDKQLFVAAVLGQKRFVKEYNIFGGNLRIMFRSLKTTEMDLVIKQMIKDWNDGKISGPAQSLAEATKYQMILALDAIEVTRGLVAMPTLDEYEYDATDIPAGGTILPLVLEHVEKEVLSMEPLRRAVAKVYAHFMDTISKLEAMAENESFW